MSGKWTCASPSTLGVGATANGIWSCGANRARSPAAAAALVEADARKIGRAVRVKLRRTISGCLASQKVAKVEEELLERKKLPSNAIENWKKNVPE